MPERGVTRIPRLRNLLRLLPEDGPQRALILSSFANRVGTGLFLPTAMLYFTRVVHLTPARVGAGLTIAGLIGLAVGVPAGDLADRHGPRAAQLATLAVQAVTMAAFVLVHSWWAFTLVATLDRLAESANNAARGAVVARVGGERPAQFRARLLAFVNAAVILGTLGAVFAVQLGTRVAYTTLILMNAASYVVCALLLLRVPDYAALPRPSRERRLAALSDRPYMAFAALDGAMSLQSQAVVVLLPVWIVEHTHAPRWTVSAVFAASSAAVVLLLPRIGAKVETVADGGRAFRLAGLLLLASCPLLAVAADVPAWSAVPLLLIAIGIYSAGSVWQTSAGLALSFGLAPDHAQGQYQGLRGLGVDTGQAVAPLVLTTVFLGRAGWVLLGLFFAALGMLGPPLTRWAERDRDRRSALSARAAPASTSGPSAP